MKINLNKTLVNLLVISILIPSMASAEDIVTPVVKAKTNFCAKLDAVNIKLAEQITKTEEKQSLKEKDNLSKLAKRESDADAKRALNRNNADAKRVKNWDKIINKAKTDTQKTAVTTYKTAIQKAVDNRKASVDAAIKVYRDGLTTAINSDTVSTTTAIATFKTSIASALEGAKIDCANGIANKTISTSYNKKIKDAKDALKIAKKDNSKKTAVATLKKTRDEAIKLAEATFKSDIEKAKADLTLALN